MAREVKTNHNNVGNIETNLANNDNSGDAGHHHPPLHDRLPHGDRGEHAPHLGEAATHRFVILSRSVYLQLTIPDRSVLRSDHLLGVFRHRAVRGHAQPAPQGHEGQEVGLLGGQVLHIHLHDQDPTLAEVPGVQGVGQGAPDQAGAGQELHHPPCTSS